MHAAGSKVVINKAGKQLKEKTFEAKVPAMTVQKVVEEIREEEEEEAAETGESTPASAHQTPVYQVKKPFVSEAPLRYSHMMPILWLRFPVTRHFCAT